MREKRDMRINVISVIGDRIHIDKKSTTHILVISPLLNQSQTLQATRDRFRYLLILMLRNGTKDKHPQYLARQTSQK